MSCAKFAPFLLLTLLPPFAAAAARAGPASRPAALRVLFVGNSYTEVNNLPAVFAKLAVSAGYPKPVVDSITPGGKTLLQHLSDPATLAKIDSGAGHEPWDVVVLQEQSQLPAMAEQSRRAREDFLAGAVGLYDRVKAKNRKARVVLYETWARHPDFWKPGEREAVGKDAADMQALLRKWYTFAATEAIPKQSQAADKTDVTVAPVGDAWEAQYGAAGALRLHAADQSHPSPAGTYLAGLVFLHTIYPDAPAGVRETGGLKEADAKHLQQVAAEVMSKAKEKPADAVNLNR